MNIIAAVDKNLALGRNGELLYRIPDDMARFRALTMGGAVIMGRKTFESIGMRPLAGRKNFVLSATLDSAAVTVCRSLDELFALLADIPSDKQFVIGGESVYRALLPFCGAAFITEIDSDVQKNADSFFPTEFYDGAWKPVSRSERHHFGDISYYFCEYKNGRS